MTHPLLPASLTAAVCLLGLSGTASAQCEADGDVEFVCGPISPEDLVEIPNTPWVLVSSMEDDGYLSATDTRNLQSTRLFPLPTSRPRHDAAIYGGCGDMTPTQFRPHGVSLRRGTNSHHTLYVVRHGARESIEVFDVNAGESTPTLTWVGCAVAPEGLGLNAVVPLPDGGFAATSPSTGDIWEWHSDGGWARVPGSEEIGPNGLENLRRRQLVLRRWLCGAVNHPAVPWADTRAQGDGRERRLLHRQRPLDTRRRPPRCRSQCPGAKRYQQVHPRGRLRRRPVARRKGRHPGGRLDRVLHLSVE